MSGGDKVGPKGQHGPKGRIDGPKGRSHAAGGAGGL